MSLLAIVAALIVIGVLLWALGQVPFIDANMKKVIYVLVVVFVCLWLVSVFFPEIGNIRVGK